MNEKINDGGPAFGSYIPETDSNYAKLTTGMSLRDYFAGQVLAGVHASCADGYPNAEHVAKEAYKAADAMIAARGVK